MQEKSVFEPEISDSNPAILTIGGSGLSVLFENRN